MTVDAREYLPELPELIIIDLSELEHPCMSTDDSFDELEERASLELARDLIIARSAREAKGRIERRYDKKCRPAY